jgi:Holliday junction resolvase RusA-like endonuclease
MNVMPCAIIDPADLPFLPPPARVIAVELPTPPSTNSLWRQTAGSKASGTITLSEKYKAWKRQADMQVMAAGTLRGFKTITGKFEARIILARGPGDLDNRIKSVLDWAQSREIIGNDKHCERITAEWGDAPTGCRLVIRELA